MRLELALKPPLVLDDEDRALASRLARRDEQALVDLYAEYGRRLHAYALRITGNASTAEEVLQDTMLAAWNGAARYEGRSRLIAWLLAIVRHHALNAIRRKRLPTQGLDAAAELAAADAGPDEQLEQAACGDNMRKALARLSSEHREVIDLVFYQELTLAEVALVCRCPVGTVKSRLHHAKERLRDVLNGGELRGRH